MSSAVSPEVFPPVPQEIFLRFMYFSLYTGGEFSSFMQADDLSGVLDDFPSRKARFLQSWCPVSKAVKLEAEKIAQVFVLIRSSNDLSSALASLEGLPPADALNWGPRCQRLELRIVGSFYPAQVASIIEKTPNLRVFVARNIWTDVFPPPRPPPDHHRRSPRHFREKNSPYPVRNPQ